MQIAKFDRNLRSLTIAFLLFLFSFNPGFAQDGAALFDANCKSCHSPGADKVVGPGLKDIEKRRNRDWIHTWVKNSGAVIKSGDDYGVKLFESYNKTQMPAQNLSVVEIDAVLDYIKAYVPKVTGPPPPPPGTEPAEKGFPWGLLVVVFVLIILAGAFARVQKGLDKVIREKEGIPQPVAYKGKEAAKIWARNNKKLIAILLLLFTLWGSVDGWYALKGIGVTQGYKPDQPINFSHKIHAGDNGIACLYCHSGAEKSRHANIPSVNVCMNCHKYIKQGPVTGKEEIAKIYAAVGWDGSNYTGKQMPVQWVRVHNLPDLAYFNHSQHVKVGKIECQKCHGEVQTMDVVKQDQPLTMGWCIECHRTTEVKMEGNGYYTQLHETLKHKYGENAKITVDKMGGIECARCHY
ncbi:MAG: c-type cytochrome [Bacteroidia bacterium]